MEQPHSRVLHTHFDGSIYRVRVEHTRQSHQSSCPTRPASAVALGTVPASSAGVKTTEYFRYIRNRPDRGQIRDEWIRSVVAHPVVERRQADGRIRRWARVPEYGNRWLRVVLLPDAETVHNAFFDRRFTL